MKATLTETTSTTLPERRTWIVTYHNISFTFNRKAPAKQLKAIFDIDMPTTLFRPAWMDEN